MNGVVCVCMCLCVYRYWIVPKAFISILNLLQYLCMRVYAHCVCMCVCARERARADLRVFVYKCGGGG